MHRKLPHALALPLGVGVALIASCGGTSTKGGVPAANAGDLKAQITDVREAVEDGRCADVPGQLRQVDEGINALPSTVNARLRQSLTDASVRLRQTATEECQTDTQTTETVTTETQTETTQTDTTETEPPASEPPETQPPETEPPVTPPPPPPPATPPPPPPPAPAPSGPPSPETPSGGATPPVDG